MPFLVNPRKKEPKNLPKPFQFQETKPKNPFLKKKRNS